MKHSVVYYILYIHIVHVLLQVFDLKGSMRSRYVDPSKDSSSDVLLDENYLNCKSVIVGRVYVCVCVCTVNSFVLISFLC